MVLLNDIAETRSRFGLEHISIYRSDKDIKCRVRDILTLMEYLRLEVGELWLVLLDLFILIKNR